ncbi:hypothetical protein [Acinetobacter towneri]|uniref:RHS repeat-associated core domain-containing protein n=1 Tax=Acinetobacter towneri TaxID=202956 RepID=A0ABX7TGG4_9GAMM|nr:hypothetical protein [Acinetobacter towneri]QTD62707.1 hypothetical protein J4G45_06010 [Acinetobacter towneri]
MSIQHRLATPVIQPRMRFFDTDGKPLVGGKVYAFKVGTEEFKPTYRNSELTALNTNPVVLDGVGSALIYLRGANLLKIYDRHGNFIEERIEYQQRERAQFYDDYGRPLKNGYVYTYDYQSTIRKTSYSIDDAINPNPIVLDENGTALVNIVGAYRLRQYNSKNVFVGDQDFKRPPIKALTSVVYPLYFEEGVITGFCLRSSMVNSAQVVGENLASQFKIEAAYIRELLNNYVCDPEIIATCFSVDSALLINKKDPYIKHTLNETVSSAFNVDIAQITKVVNYLKHTLEPESISSSFYVDSAILDQR